MDITSTSAFYIIAHEQGAENPAIPAWANKGANPAGLATQYTQTYIERRDVPAVPGAYQLLNVLSADECQRLINLSEALGYLKDAAVSLPRDVRHNDNVVWITDPQTDDLLWQRMTSLAELQLENFQGKKPLGLNARFRFYRYCEGDYFAFHTDGAWPGSRVVNNTLVTNAYPDRYSMMTVLVFLNENFSGGATRFLVTPEGSRRSAQPNEESRVIDLRTPVGGVLCFPHGMHPLHCVHSSEPITDGTKYIIRTDMLFEL